MYGYIYKTTNMINNKFYIGQHKGEFDINYLGSGKYLNNAINKNGRNNFESEIIYYVDDREQANIMEYYHIRQCKNKYGKDMMYNIQPGGEGCGCGEDNPAKIQEVRDKISAGNSGKVRTPEMRKRVSIGMIGYKQSPEHIENARKAITGRNLSPEHCEKIRVNMLGSKRGKYEMKNPIERSENLKLAWIKRRADGKQMGGRPRKEIINAK